MRCSSPRGWASGAAGRRLGHSVRKSARGFQPAPRSRPDSGPPARKTHARSPPLEDETAAVTNEEQRQQAPHAGHGHGAGLRGERAGLRGRGRGGARAGGGAPAAATSGPGRGGRPAAAAHHRRAGAASGTARRLAPQRPADGRAKAVLLSGRRAEASSRQRWGAGAGARLDARVPYRCAATATARAIAEARVSHRSEPAKIEADNG